MDEYTRINHKRYSYDDSDNKKIKYLRGLLTRILISIILIISANIFIKINNENVYYLDKYIYTDSLQFTTLNNWYKKHFGNILPDIPTESTMVFNSSDFKNNNYSKYHEGVKIDLQKSNPISLLYGGIVVFIGEKENYGNTVIIQGNDGIDYWYGGITNVGINLYDYLEKDTLIGESEENYIYLVLQKNGEYLSYEEYINQS